MMAVSQRETSFSVGDDDDDDDDDDDEVVARLRGVVSFGGGHSLPRGPSALAVEIGCSNLSLLTLVPFTMAKA